MHKVILLIGGNEGNPKKNIQEVTKIIHDQIGAITQASSIYESEPWGFNHQQNFMNQVLEIDTLLSPMDVLKQSQRIEKTLGRRPKQQIGYEARTMDIDILFYDSIILKSPTLTIPHPRLHERLFTLLPLNEKWSQYIHPVLNKEIAQLLDECGDDGWVKKTM